MLSSSTASGCRSAPGPLVQPPRARQADTNLLRTAHKTPGPTNHAEPCGISADLFRWVYSADRVLMACQSPYFSNILTTPVIVGCHRPRFHKTLHFSLSSIIFSKRHFVLGSDLGTRKIEFYFVFSSLSSSKFATLLLFVPVAVWGRRRHCPWRFLVCIRACFKRRGGV